MLVCVCVTEHLPPPANISASFNNDNLIVKWDLPRTRNAVNPNCFENEVEIRDQVQYASPQAVIIPDATFCFCFFCTCGWNSEQDKLLFNPVRSKAPYVWLFFFKQNNNNAAPALKNVSVLIKTQKQGEKTND